MLLAQRALLHLAFYDIGANKLDCRERNFAFPRASDGNELISVIDSAFSNIDKAKLIRIRGRSAEPIAFDGQSLIVQEVISEMERIQSLDGQLVVAVDEIGTRLL
jgi:hypothetical protein